MGQVSIHARGTTSSSLVCVVAEVKLEPIRCKLLSTLPTKQDLTFEAFPFKPDSAPDKEGSFSTATYKFRAHPGQNLELNNEEGGCLHAFRRMLFLQQLAQNAHCLTALNSAPPGSFFKQKRSLWAAGSGLGTTVVRLDRALHEQAQFTV